MAKKSVYAVTPGVNDEAESVTRPADSGQGVRTHEITHQSNDCMGRPINKGDTVEYCDGTRWKVQKVLGNGRFVYGRGKAAKTFPCSCVVNCSPVQGELVLF